MLPASFDVITALTPLSFSAFDVSMESILAWAWGLCKRAPYNMPGLEISSTNTALPVALSGVSMRFARVLIISYFFMDPPWIERSVMISGIQWLQKSSYIRYTGTGSRKCLPGCPVHWDWG